MKLTEAEKIILESLREQWKWIARDRNKGLWVYNKKPMKSNIIWNTYDGYDFKREKLSLLFKDELFSFIIWEDEESTSIDELLENCEVQDDE